MVRKSLIRRIYNRILHLLARSLPGASTIRPFLHKLRGVKIYGKAFIGDEVYLENEYPENIEIEDEALIGLRSTIIAHFGGSGKVIIGKKSWIAANCLITASKDQILSIGEGSFIAAGSVVTKSVPCYTFVAGVPAKPKRKIAIALSSAKSYEQFRAGLTKIDEDICEEKNSVGINDQS